MKKITASRISDGNKLFPASITIDSTGLRVKIPGFWRNEETFVSYHDISAVSVDMPMIPGVTGFATISFNAMGSPVKAHGFTKGEVNEIKAAIENGKRNSRTDNGNSIAPPTNTGDTTNVINKAPGFGHFMGKALGGAINESFSLSSKLDEEERVKQEKVENLAQMKMSAEKDELIDQLNFLSSLGSSNPDKKIKNIIIDKMDFGVMKLRTLGATEEAEYFDKKLHPLKKRSWF